MKQRDQGAHEADSQHSIDWNLSFGINGSQLRRERQSTVFSERPHDSTSRSYSRSTTDQIQDDIDGHHDDSHRARSKSVECDLCDWLAANWCEETGGVDNAKPESNSHNQTPEPTHQCSDDNNLWNISLGLWNLFGDMGNGVEGGNARGAWEETKEENHPKGVPPRLVDDLDKNLMKRLFWRGSDEKCDEQEEGTTIDADDHDPHGLCEGIQSPNVCAHSKGQEGQRNKVALPGTRHKLPLRAHSRQGPDSLRGENGLGRL